MKSLFVSLIAFLLANSSAFAAPFCLPFAATGLKSESCDDNFAIGKKADSCLSLYTNELNTGRAHMDKISKEEAAKGAAQNSSQATTASLLDRTVSELDRLIGNGEAAKFAVKSYSDNLSLPEDYDQPQTTGMSTAKYLSVEPCYATPYRVIKEDAAVLELMVDDLRKAKSEVLAKGGAAKVQSTQMGSTSQILLKSSPKAPEATLPKSKDKWRDSDVTGTKEEKK